MQALGLLLLTGGEGRRFGAPKHLQDHPGGGTWAGYLVSTFREVHPTGPIHILGAPVREHPDLPRVDDPRQGPAVALRTWAAGHPSGAMRWWILACDQVHWTPAALRTWDLRAREADPGATQWVLARVEDRVQYFGSILPTALLPTLAVQEARSLRALALPSLVLEAEGSAWRDVDRPEDLGR
jgi:molybdopterin-guanine dinucleotide biosynthesis protein A